MSYDYSKIFLYKKATGNFYITFAYSTEVLGEIGTFGKKRYIHQKFSL